MRFTASFAIKSQYTIVNVSVAPCTAMQCSRQNSTCMCYTCMDYAAITALKTQHFTVKNAHLYALHWCSCYCAHHYQCPRYVYAKAQTTVVLLKEIYFVSWVTLFRYTSYSLKDSMSYPNTYSIQM